MVLDNADLMNSVNYPMSTLDWIRGRHTGLARLSALSDGGGIVPVGGSGQQFLVIGGIMLLGYLFLKRSRQ